MLTGITAKQGLGFTRAILFRIDEEQRLVKGLAALGPLTGAEASLDWDETNRIEEAVSEHGEDVFDHLLDRAAQFERDRRAGGKRTPLDLRTRNCQIDSDHTELFGEVCKSTSRVVGRQQHDWLNALLSSIELEELSGHELAFVPLVESGGSRAGFLVADRSYQLQFKPIQPVDLKNLDAFAELAALALETEDLRGRLQDERRLKEWEAFIGSTVHTIVGRLAESRKIVTNINQAVEQEPPSPQLGIEAFIETLRESHASAMSAVNSLKDYARPAVDSFQMVDLTELIRTAAKGHKAVKLTLPEEPVKISGDADRILAMLSNLVVNSEEAASDEAGLQIRISLDVSEASQGMLARIEVTDNAGGMPLTTLDDAQRPWYSTKGKGRGLGLNIAKRIADGHGGKLRIGSSETVGHTTVQVDLPVYHQETGESANVKTASG